MKSYLFKSQNKGISLVEIIVVVAIISVLVGVSSLGFGMVSTKAATQCANAMQISLNRCRISTMGKQGGYVAFYMDSDHEVRVVEKYGDSPALLTTAEMNSKVGTKIGKKGIVVTCGSTNLTDATNVAVYYRFNRSDGSLNSGDDNLPIIVKKGNRTTYTIKIQDLTGKVTVTKS